MKFERTKNICFYDIFSIQCCKKYIQLTDNLSSHAKCQLDDGLVTITGRMVENAEDILPPGSNIGRLRMNDLRHASDDHISDNG